jgi:hypothetical protein
MTRTLALWVLALAALAFIALPLAAFAHGDAQWIADDPKLSYCCGVHDCERAPIAAVRPIPGGWEIVATGQRFMEGDADLHPSRDQFFWWCRPPQMFPKAKCLMAPAGGA